ncbi:uncharacterized protein LOC105284385 isoform X1 [Ooceraea biroi]|uniref:uncharacterized protein LOC105284385 isoform X1 n=1 Tax=Ooceraea biroi TaxID=2015173 RepID=UPI000F099CE6|nr:uncharacterized protein LOC105284385 isoform X1 [Ooceraea biroi]
MAEKCKECGCKCGTCAQDSSQQQHCDMHLHAEIENLRQRLLERDNHIVTMETQFLNEADKFPNGELASMKEELLIWQEKYSRLHEAHKRVQKVNQSLEDKLLRIVDKCETEKGALTKDIATLSHRLADANCTIHRLTQDNEKYRNDVSLAIQLLQCKPANFVGQKYDSLPSEVQAKVRTYVAQKRCATQPDPAQSDVKSITVPISTFPPTAMVYNITKPTVEKHSDDDNSDDGKPPMDIVSAAIMAKVLEDREKERIFAKHCETCTCHRSILTVDAETQTCASDALSYLEGRARSIERQQSEALNGEKYSGRDRLQPSLPAHALFYEINENGEKIRRHVNGECAKYVPVPAACIKDKLIIGGRSSRSTAQEHCPTEANCAKNNNCKRNSLQNHESKCSPLFSRLNDLNRLNSDKTKPLRVSNNNNNNSRKYESSTVEGKSVARCCNKSERSPCEEHHGGSTVVQLLPDNRLTDKDQTHIDIINDRLWKNEWTKLRSETGENKCRASRGIELDVINDRDWRNDNRSAAAEPRHAAQFTLIEVKSPESSVANHHDGQTEVATSPSFSSDSMVISSSDPSSSCSDVAQSLTVTGGAFNATANRPNASQSRVTGARNCLVRVTPGSKNILLDNAGQYKAVLYSSGNGGKANTALVHVKKASRASSERSTSTGSEDNSSQMLLQDNQLQRVAEWVQSSMCLDNPAAHDSNKAKRQAQNAARDDSSLPSVYTNTDLLTRRQSSEQDAGDLARDAGPAVPRKSSKNIESYIEDMKNQLNNASSSERLEPDESENLITFEVSDEQLEKDSRRKDLDYEVKITKEMEETYLKLAASLDPVTLSLSSTSDAELTIEKYRQEYKRLHVSQQRVQDKAGSKA